MHPLIEENRLLKIYREKSRYDLPLNRGAGTTFLMLLIMLMTVLAVLSTAAFFTLSEMSKRWSEGLENRASVEISAKSPDEKLLTSQQVEKISEKAARLLKQKPFIEKADVMSRREIISLISPWVGDNPQIDEFPLPGIISLSLKKDTPYDLDRLEAELKEISPNIRIDAHEDWLSDVLGFTEAMRFAASLMIIITTVITVVSVASAVKARMDVNRKEIKLLHLMGATDSYISKQFCMHTFILSLKAGIIGIVIGGAAIVLIGWTSGEMEVTLIPDFSLSVLQKCILFMIPVFMALIATLTAGYTVMNTLKKML